ncbi:hypothetical protein HY439_01295 [Candidatus Microgenomates bacterium]|nr:hypothetical protein [Candidatus Microgenomates bacterium]
MKRKIGVFDLEGPLSPQDNAYELMKLIPDGGKIFEAISRYDDLLTLEGRENYEPGDTLALIAPYLIYNGIKEKDIKSVSDTAMLVNGAPEAITWLRSSDWEVYINSTSYRPHALNIAQRVGVEESHVHCTRFALDELGQRFSPTLLSFVGRTQARMLRELYPIEGKDKEIKEMLDEFFWEILPESGLEPLNEVRVNGGNRKVEALHAICQENKVGLGDIVVVGDSITDMVMLGAVRNEGGTAVAFNANEYALNEGNVALATTDFRDLLPLCIKHSEGGLTEVHRFVSSQENRTMRPQKEGGAWWEPDSNRGNYNLIAGVEDLSPIIEVHRRVRGIVREEAAKLG